MIGHGGHDWIDFDTPDELGRRRIACTICGYVTKTRTARPISQIYATPCLNHGCGTRLQFLLSSLGIKPNSCGESRSCQEMANQMDAWGSEGCRTHREEILAHLRSAYSRTDWPTVFAAALAGATHLWLVRRINPLHPIESGLNALLDEAIERAEANLPAPEPPPATGQGGPPDP